MTFIHRSFMKQKRKRPPRFCLKQQLFHPACRRKNALASNGVSDASTRHLRRSRQALQRVYFRRSSADATSGGTAQTSFTCFPATRRRTQPRDSQPVRSAAKGDFLRASAAALQTMAVLTLHSVAFGLFMRKVFLRKCRFNPCQSTRANSPSQTLLASTF
jgi:hypothetical protein